MKNLGAVVQDVDSLPAEVQKASRMNWGVLVDAYLTDAARVGNRFAATLFLDHSGAIDDGQTIVTPPLRHLSRCGRFQLMQSQCGRDHYVVVSEYASSCI